MEWITVQHKAQFFCEHHSDRIPEHWTLSDHKESK